MLIENLEELNNLIQPKISNGYKCIIVIDDNKSNITVHSGIVNHPLDFIRNLNEFSKQVRLPVSDMTILLVGYIGKNFGLYETEDFIEISPYVYFKKPDEVNVSVGSDDSVPPTES